VVHLARLRQHQTSLTPIRPGTIPDGKIRFVVSERDPGIATGSNFRASGVDTCSQVAADVAGIHAADVRSRTRQRRRAAKRLEYYDQAQVTPEQCAPDRRQTSRRRGPDVGMNAMLLEDKVVVSGHRSRSRALHRPCSRHARREPRARGAYRVAITEVADE